MKQTLIKSRNSILNSNITNPIINSRRVQSSSQDNIRNKLKEKRKGINSSSSVTRSKIQQKERKKVLRQRPYNRSQLKRLLRLNKRRDQKMRSLKLWRRNKGKLNPKNNIRSHIRRGKLLSKKELNLINNSLKNKRRSKNNNRNKKLK